MSQQKNTPLCSQLTLRQKQILLVIIWLFILGICVVSFQLIQVIVHQFGIWSFGILPIICTGLAIMGYSASQAKRKTATNSWDMSFLIFGFPMIILLIELPFILIGLSIGNIPLLVSIFWGLLFGIPMTIYLIYFMIQIIKGNTNI